jgi:hypothetical protein
MMLRGLTEQHLLRRAYLVHQPLGKIAPLELATLSSQGLLFLPDRCCPSTPRSPPSPPILRQ